MHDMNIESSVASSDLALAGLLRNEAASSLDIMIIANGFTARAVSKSGSGPWQEFGRGDFGEKCVEAVEELSQTVKLGWLDVDRRPADVDLSQVVWADADVVRIRSWLKAAKALTESTGRNDSPSKPDEQRLGVLTAWRCQFSGCGKNLQSETLSNTEAKSSYFAHIVASSPKGPRGDRVLSAQLAANIDNIMLMCDECHRRIDRVDSDRFTVDILRAMRQSSLDEVRRLLDSLRYEEVMPVVIMGNITGQQPRFIQRDAEEAMWTRNLRMGTNRAEHYFYNAGHLHDPHAPHYWGTMFAALNEDIPVLRRLLNSTQRQDGTTMPLAIFPLHGTSVLVLAGRVIGEGSRVVVFQYNRDRPEGLPGGKWAFDDNVSRSPEGKYEVRELSSHTAGTDEACLIVSLTFKISPERLPTQIFDGVWKIGALEVTSTDQANLGVNVVSHAADIDLIALAIEEAIRKLQDEWGVRKVHLVIGAPASACFRIGQKMQARHHATFVCYEATRTQQKEFLPTIEISSTSVQELQTGERLRLA